MTWRRGALIIGGALYLLLWGLALDGASSLVAPLVIPLVLVVLVVLGVALDRFLGVPHRSPHFDGDDESTT